MSHQMYYSDNKKLQSQVIAFLRLPLIIGVVLIHTKIPVIMGISTTNGNFPIYEIVTYIFTQVIAPIRVPMFFMFSGFLFFNKTKNINLLIYRQKLKNRIHTLLVPYLIWNILFIVIHNLEVFLFPENNSIYIGEEYNINNWITTFWGSSNKNTPISYQLWFMRDLMVLSLCSPLIYFLIKKIKYCFVILLSVLWFTNCWFDICGLGIEGLFFFSLGAFFSLEKGEFVSFLNNSKLIYPLGISYLIMVSIMILSNNYDWSIYIKKICVLIGLTFALSLTIYYIQKGTWRVNRFLSESSFFIYAYHVIAIAIIKKVIDSLVRIDTDMELVIQYIGTTIIIVVLGIWIYDFIKNKFPRLTAIITGGR